MVFQRKQVTMVNVIVTEVHCYIEAAGHEQLFNCIFVM